MLTPAHPVSSNIFFAACTVVTSPLPMTGIRFTACATARMPDKFTVPLNPCSRVRPCTKIAATPTSSSTRAKSGAVRFSSSQPRRIFAVTGIFTASTMPFTSAAVFSCSIIIAEPPPTRRIFFTGQPMLMSMLATPRSWRNTAASRISSGTEPKSCTASGRSCAFVSMSLKAFGFFSSNDRAFTRSVVARSSPPSSRNVRRKGRFV